MRLLLISLSAAFAAASAGAQSTAGSEQLRAARELVEIMLPPTERNRTFETLVNSFMANQLAGMMQGNPAIERALKKHPEIKPIFAGFVERQRKLALADLRESEPGLVDAYTKAYARNFSIDELNDLHQFFTSPTGAKYTARSAALMTDPALGEWQRAIAAKAEQRKPQELQRLLEDLRPAIEKIEPETQHES